ncbi:hypothetical protein [Ochrobactrum chromiisoli]|uniref:Uncharacterized protein n=1 Tax=Ochrobactrum chromiisoli TaxID=2993941 RepID=A0ABT3QL68_9HYPH|nr:hypothetical protein [Ochrobactrum chromiisoli]MCX2696367.1 hypothetical protein [Ochrobactrum chromiisoli]
MSTPRTGTDLKQTVSDETRQVLLDTIYLHWREVRDTGLKPDQTLDALIDGLLRATADLITHTAAPEWREAIPRIAADRLIQAFKSTRERELNQDDQDIGIQGL